MTIWIPSEFLAGCLTTPCRVDSFRVLLFRPAPMQRGLAESRPSCMLPTSCAPGSPQALQRCRTPERRHSCSVCRAAQMDGEDVGSIKAAMQSADNPWQISFQMNERCSSRSTQQYSLYRDTQRVGSSVAIGPGPYTVLTVHARCDVGTSLGRTRLRGE